MGLISYTNLEDDTTADANKFNERFGAIIDEVNGNLDAQNLKNSAVTTAKIADNAVTSAKLGFEKYTDDNGWLITDLGLVKLATKKRDFTIGSTPASARARPVTWAAGSDNAPVGFSSDTSYSVDYSISMATNEGAYSYTFTIQQASSEVLPNFNLIAMNRSGATRNGDAGSAVTWVVF